MLVLNNISFEFGSRYLYEDASWHIKPGEKIGLIGANGTGKSTLLRIIVGEYQVSAGNITRRKDLTIGFLNQDLLSYQSSDSILTVAMQAFERAIFLQGEIEKTLLEMEHDHSEEILHKLHDYQVEFDALDGYNMQYKAEEILEGLGFNTADLQRPLQEFSGGWRMRVMLAKILLQKPDLLLLDEPTNHLDLPSIKWIEQYLMNYQGAVIIVSHDRYFLDRTVNKIAEVAYADINLYAGNYSFYLEEKKLREEMQRAQFKNQEKYIKEQEKLIDRFRAKASKAKMAQSRIKALDRMERIEDVEDENRQIQIKFNFTTQPGKIISELKINKKAYPSGEIFNHTSATITRGDKIALVGANGKGKSTLLRMVAGTEPFEGESIPGHNVIDAFFAQHQMESLNLDNEILTELQHFAPEQSDTTLRTLLGAFLFIGDDVFKKIKVLSGGEKSRVALAKTILTKANFLILDEPTNHLDIQSVNMLIQVLQQFEGSFVVVSHDRYFLSQIANKIWYIEDKEVKEYPGSYLEFDEWQEKQPVNKKEDSKAEKIQKLSREEAKPVETTAVDNKKELKKLQTQFKDIENQLEQITEQKEKLEQDLANPEVYGHAEKMAACTKQYQQVEQSKQVLDKQWEDLFERIAALESV